MLIEQLPLAIALATNRVAPDWLNGPAATVGLAGAIAIGGVAVAAFRAKHKDVDDKALLLKAEASTRINCLILNEARRVFSVANEHLPSRLSQADSKDPSLSRFDEFCVALRALPDGDLDDRGCYKKIIKDAFGGIVSESANRLLDSLEAGELAHRHPILNPTGAVFGSAGETFLTFIEVSDFDSRNRWIERWFRRTWIAGTASLIVPFLASLALIVVSVLKDPRAESAGQWAVIYGGVISSMCLVTPLFVASFCLRSWLIKRARKCQAPINAEQNFTDRTKERNGRENH